MKLYVNKKPFSIHNKIFIKDENNLDVYEISSKFPSLVAKTTINDINGNSFIYVEEKASLMMPNYDVYIYNRFAFNIKKTSLLIKNNYSLSNGYKVIGDFRMINFVIYDDVNNIIGSIKKIAKFITIGENDKYEIDIIDSTKKEIILAIIAMITSDVDRNRNSSN